jgi:predicted fused transcriptional regulator/phosphomethylpyrimidine kinase
MDSQKAGGLFSIFVNYRYKKKCVLRTRVHGQRVANGDRDEETKRHEPDHQQKEEQDFAGRVMPLVVKVAVPVPVLNQQCD